LVRCFITPFLTLIYFSVVVRKNEGNDLLFSRRQHSAARRRKSDGNVGNGTNCGQAGALLSVHAALEHSTSSPRAYCTPAFETLLRLRSQSSTRTLSPCRQR
jgi:hypothetical protein